MAKEVILANAAEFPRENPDPILRIDRRGRILYANKSSDPFLRAWNCAEGGQLPERFCRLLLRHRGTTPADIDIPCGERVYAFRIVPIPKKNYLHLYGTDATGERRSREQLFSYQRHLRAMAAELSLAEDHERRELARFLHDQISQALALASIRLQLALQSAGSPPLRRMLKKVAALLQNAINGSRELTAQISPPILYELGLEPAIKWLAGNLRRLVDLKVVVISDKKPKPLKTSLSVFLYRSVRELLVNVAKHAGTTRARVTLAHDGNCIRVSVRDAGRGFDVSRLTTAVTNKRGFGLFSIHERLKHLGGRMEIDSRPGKGTCVTLVAPVAEDREEKG